MPNDVKSYQKQLISKLEEINEEINKEIHESKDVKYNAISAYELEAKIGFRGAIRFVLKIIKEDYKTSN